MEFFLVMSGHEFMIDELEGGSTIRWFIFKTRIDEADGLEWNVCTFGNKVVTFTKHVHQLRKGLCVEGRTSSEESVDQTAQCPYIHINPEFLII